MNLYIEYAQCHRCHLRNKATKKNQLNTYIINLIFMRLTPLQNQTPARPRGAVLPGAQRQAAGAQGLPVRSVSPDSVEAEAMNEYLEEDDLEATEEQTYVSGGDWHAIGPAPADAPTNAPVKARLPML